MQVPSSGAFFLQSYIAALKLLLLTSLLNSCLKLLWTGLFTLKSLQINTQNRNDLA